MRSQFVTSLAILLIIVVCLPRHAMSDGSHERAYAGEKIQTQEFLYSSDWKDVCMSIYNPTIIEYQVSTHLDFATREKTKGQSNEKSPTDLLVHPTLVFDAPAVPVEATDETASEPATITSGHSTVNGIVFHGLDKTALPSMQLQGAMIELRFQNNVLDRIPLGPPANLWDEKITVEPSESKVRTGERFKVVLSIKNTTPQPQEIQVWTCGWVNQWKANNEEVRFVSIGCTRNFIQAKQIAPGEAYTKEVPMVVYATDYLQSLSPQESVQLDVTNEHCLVGSLPASQGTIQFKMGFTSMHSPRTYWSNDVKIEVIP